MLRTWLVFIGLTLSWIVTRAIYLEAWGSGYSLHSIQSGTADDCSICDRLIEKGEISTYHGDQAEIRSLKLGMHQQLELPPETIMTSAARVEACTRICEAASSSSKIERWPQP